MEKKTPPPTPPRKASPPTPPKTPIPTADIPTKNPNVVIDRATNKGKFVAGNQLWKLAKGGRFAIITDATALWQLAVNYFEWCDQNPLQKAELVKYQGDAEVMDVPLGRPYSMDALTIFVGVSPSYFRSRKSELSDKLEAGKATADEIDLLDTIVLIQSIVRNQRFEGAAVGHFKENLISRVDGYADNVNQHNTGEVRQTVVVRDQKTADNLAKLKDVMK